MAEYLTRESGVRNPRHTNEFTYEKAKMVLSGGDGE